MATKIQHARGIEANAPVLGIGELYYCTDTNYWLNGTSSGNKVLTTSTTISTDIPWNSITLINGYTGTVLVRINAIGQLEYKVNIIVPNPIIAGGYTASGGIPAEFRPSVNELLGCRATIGGNIFLWLNTSGLLYGITSPVADSVISGTFVLLK